MLDEEGPTRHALAAKTRWTTTPALIEQLETLGKDIKEKNRDIPDYLSGETRELNK